jgi:anaerobic selenocysteine-containing dehydrogenase
VVVDSSNPLQTAADTSAYRKAFEKLDLLVVIDIAETETTQLADYVLPAPSQYEKCEATFFTLEFPTNHFHLRRPILAPQGNTLPEPEIYLRLMVAMGALPARFPLLERAARLHRRFPKPGLFPRALATALALRPRWKPYVTAILYATLGKALPAECQAAAVLWGACLFYARRYPRQVRRAGFSGEGTLLGEALFQRILDRATAVPISAHTYEEMWDLVRHPGGRVHLAVPEMLAELKALESEPEEDYTSSEFPFVLAAGERRSYNANQIYRDQAWRRNDPDGALRIHPEDATRLGLQDGQAAVCESATGSVPVRIRCDDSMRCGCLSLPHGYGMTYPDPHDPKTTRQNGPRVNLLTSAGHCDPLAKTPYHKYVPVRLRSLEEAE